MSNFKRFKVEMCELIFVYFKKERLKLEKEKLRLQELELKQREQELTTQRTASSVNKQSSTNDSSASSNLTENKVVGSPRTNPNTNETIRKDDLNA